MGSGISKLYSGTYGARNALIAGDASFMPNDDKFVEFIAKRRDVDPNNAFDVIAHGTPTGIEIINHGEKVIVDARKAARLIRSLPDYHGQDIRLLSCSTGARADGFAQNLANKLGVKVKAPNDILWSSASGKHFIAARAKSGQADLSKRGKFITYKPGGNKR